MARVSAVPGVLLDIGKMVDALEVLASEPCESFTTGTCEIDQTRSPNAFYTAYRYCTTCRLRAALRGEVVAPESEEAAHERGAD